MKPWFDLHGSLVLSAITLTILIVHPVPSCIACEPGDPWGHGVHLIDTLESLWLISVPVVAAFFGLRRGAFVPIAATLAVIIEQFFGGLSWESLIYSDGPFLIIFGSVVFGGCFALGLVLRETVRWTGNFWRQKPL